MEMNFKKYLDMQRELDAYVEKRHPRRDGEDRSPQKTLAVLIEIGEMLNELPESFKYWSFKQNDFDKALEEFVDVFHLLLSLGIELGYEDVVELVVPYHSERTICGQSLALGSAMGHFIGKNSRTRFHLLFEEFLTLGKVIGFTDEMIAEAYEKKNAVNFDRQDNKY